MELEEESRWLGGRGAKAGMTARCAEGSSWAWVPAHGGGQGQKVQPSSPKSFAQDCSGAFARTWVACPRPSGIVAFWSPFFPLPFLGLGWLHCWAHSCWVSGV